MGQKSSHSKANASVEEAAQRAGRISVRSRYHQLPQRIEHDYDIKDHVLGSGYNGVVRMAVGKGATNPQQYAVKAFKLGNITADKRAQLDSEVGVFLEMDHPHVARLFDVYETEEFMHLIMECLNGGELFDRVTERKRYSEQDAAEATRQMLLSLNYLHANGIVHRDLKLENFLYDNKESDHLKLIDFGFSKVWDPNVKMHVSCGTLSYVAPEVLDRNYTMQCDLWSLGVIAFILLAGYMPFSGSEAIQTKNILAGKFTMKKERWASVSKEATSFVQALLQVDPEKRLNAAKALEHPWIVQRQNLAEVQIDASIAEGLRSFGQASKFRRACLETMAWSLSNEERAKVREYFISMDKNNQGTITLKELQGLLMGKFEVSDAETRQIFEALDSNQDDTIHYTDFLAAMVNTRIAMHEDLLKQAFRRFDIDNTGYITVDNLREVMGDKFAGEQVENLLSEADILNDNRISYAEFVAYLRGTPLSEHQEAANQFIDMEIARKTRNGSTRSTGSKESASKMMWTAVPAMLRLNTMSMGESPSLNSFMGRKNSKEAAGAGPRRNSKDRAAPPTTPTVDEVGESQAVREAAESSASRGKQQPQCCTVS